MHGETTRGNIIYRPRRFGVRFLWLYAHGYTLEVKAFCNVVGGGGGGDDMNESPRSFFH